jgi:hypothetical protein
VNIIEIASEPLLDAKRGRTWMRFDNSNAHRRSVPAPAFYRRSSSSGCTHGYGVISRSVVSFTMCTVRVSHHLKGSAFPEAEWSFLREIRPPLRHR